MGKSKSKGSAPAPVANLSKVKNGRVEKSTAQVVKAKAADVAKAVKKAIVPVKEDSSDEDSDDSSDAADSDSSAASDSDEESVAGPVKATNGVKKDADSSDSDSSDSESDEEKAVVAKPTKKANGVSKNTKPGAEASEEESFHSADDKPAPEKFEPDSDSDSDSDSTSDEDSEDGSEDSDSDDGATPVKGAVKVNGAAKDDDSDSSDDSSSDEEEEPATKKRKADDDVPARAKKIKAQDESASGVGANGETANLFVGRISWATDDDALYQEFAPFGEITGCRVVYDRDSGRSKGFGYVTYAKLEDAIKAKEAKHEALFDGRNINVDYSQPRNDAGGDRKPRESFGDRAKRFGDTRGAASDTIFIGNLSFEATAEVVREVFEGHGNITRVSIPTDRESGQIKGFGYVGFETIGEAQAALDALTGVEIAGRAVRLDFASARPAESGGGDRGGRGGGGFRGGRGDRGGGGFRGRGDRGGGGFRGRGGDRGGRGRGGFSTNRGGMGDFQGKKITF